MKIGVFDSGLGGLIITKALIGALPEYDFAYLGDTANLPYGTRSGEVIRSVSERAINWLFETQDCALAIIACNTASIAALKYLQKKYPARKILGVIIPTAEEVARRGFKRVGVIATQATIQSRVYEQELAKLDPAIEVMSRATPLLVPLIENGGDKYAPEVINDYLSGFEGIEALILGCTHYPHYKDLIAMRLPRAEIISQDEIIPESLTLYLARHGEIAERLSRGGIRRFFITDMTPSYASQAERMFGGEIPVEKVAI